MTPKTIRLVRTSWTAARPTTVEAIEAFYGHLSELDPALKNKFRGIVHVFDVAVNQLGYMNGLRAVLRTVGVAPSASLAAARLGAASRGATLAAISVVVVVVVASSASASDHSMPTTSRI